MAHLYVICRLKNQIATGPVKVGITSNLSSRISSIQTGCPYPLIFYEIWELEGGCSRYVEKAFHHIQRDKALSGEWFQMAPRKAATIIELYIREAFILSGSASAETVWSMPWGGLVGVTFDSRGRRNTAGTA